MGKENVLFALLTGDPSQEDMDVILILSKDSYYVARYDDEVDKVKCCEELVVGN